MREILIKGQLNKFKTFQEFAEEFQLGSEDLILTNAFIYKPFMADLNLECQVVFQESFGAGEPSEEMITEIFKAVKPETFERIVAVGGGAIMDIGKVLSLKRTGSVHDLYFKKAEVVPEKELIAIPTTCGTGSEVTNISVAIVRDDNGNTTKLGLVSDLLIPSSVCLIPEMLKTLPYAPFASSAIDALIHAVESYLSPSRATMTSELYGVKAMELILEGFRRIREGGEEARFNYLDEFVTAACYAGIAFLQAGCATVHAMSFPLGGTYHVPHGESNYALFGKVLEKYDAAQPEGKIMEFKQTIAGILGGTAEDAIGNLNKLLETILHLKPLREYGFKEEDIETFADSVLENQQRLVVNSYVPLTKALIKEIYAECL
ncbi:MAG: 4-hydroxybutyrate dehydrogenase [Clostridiales Family XIII bacterium]|uniref:4-hydroxybutyrate dehydrogenase n=1 Tax=Hominibacterium faecale TaxID=2839743 RepID=UPI0022B2A4A9|nr:4-hydroxybutyrate dehydrogenase [Hominibacterium faecale]MCI7302559.1 4-hydroxybutyrate dehydrogenase [Clostridia bacterium]MDE8734838.1 4-hydroxybutyrate dehydrogenase [Eubacteriales bacterium DFI.9.88]MDY3010531.1 4-hydroxybutyrate dehydrogenase [Clostridiales Family XIII bacterium]